MKTCILCNINKSKNFIKPVNKQILSYNPLERVEMDVTYLNKLFPKIKSAFNYILCFVDHFSKFCKCYLLKNRSSVEVLDKIKKFIDEISKPDVLQSDSGGEFKAKKIINFLESENILFINSSSHHPKTNGVVESFNKTIINKMEYLLLDEKNNSDIEECLEKAVKIYNNIIHTSTKMEPIKAIKLKESDLIEKVIKNVIKSQSDKNIAINDIIKKGEKCLLNNVYNKKGDHIKSKFNKKG